MKNARSESLVVSCGWTDKHEVIGAFCSLANAPKKYLSSLYFSDHIHVKINVKHFVPGATFKKISIYRHALPSSAPDVLKAWGKCKS
jgi:hypothetical protein